MSCFLKYLVVRQLMRQLVHSPSVDSSSVSFVRKGSYPKRWIDIKLFYNELSGKLHFVFYLFKAVWTLQKCSCFRRKNNKVFFQNTALFQFKQLLVTNLYLNLK